MPGADVKGQLSEMTECWRTTLHDRIAMASWRYFWPFPKRDPDGRRLPYVRDPEERKVLGRVLADIVELERLHDKGRLQGSGEQQAARLLEKADPTQLRLDAGLLLLRGLDLVLAEHGDANYVVRQVELALLQEEGSTSLLTWDRLYGKERPRALESYMEKGEVTEEELKPLKAQLGAFVDSRSDFYTVQKARLRMKKRLMWWVTGVTAVLVILLGFAVASEPADLGDQALAVGLAGAVGGSLSGAFRLRDALELGAALREFRPAVLLQPVFGAASALVVLVLMESELIDPLSQTGWAPRTVFGFVAGFSEPFVLDLVKRVAGIEDEIEASRDIRPG